ncbi:hypothetical protein HIM_09745 [Hirsutella minnesotensis 3608]|uniref:Uncharacterized protein n=1 Tax=Hirsutella minnesotensis 3608 TaxID=1043627 RepID=A0A0F7ZL14_9HYPO|nr:hypothetical protein HIM_09745 [Hirsutella minnesotensis 3608]
MLFTTKAFSLAAAFGCLFWASSTMASPITQLATTTDEISAVQGDIPNIARRAEVQQVSGRANSDVGFDALYAILHKAGKLNITQEVITKMQQNELVVETPAMAIYIAEARAAVEANDQEAAYKAMRNWSVEVDRSIDLNKPQPTPIGPA